MELQVISHKNIIKAFPKDAQSQAARFLQFYFNNLGKDKTTLNQDLILIQLNLNLFLLMASAHPIEYSLWSPLHFGRHIQ